MAINRFAEEVLADGPIGFWRLGEALGSVTAADASGNGNHGSCSGTITFGQPGFHGGDTAALFAAGLAVEHDLGTAAGHTVFATLDGLVSEQFKVEEFSVHYGRFTSGVKLR